MNSRYFFTTDSWQKTALGSPIALSASHPLEELKGKRPILLMGGVHGDEPEGVALAEATLAWLKQECLSGRRERLAPWLLIPCLNVDGYNSRRRVNGRGVDLNRNYPSKNWSSEATQARYFPGPQPASEPEIQMVVRLLKEFRPRLVIHCHSWEPMIVYTGEPARVDAERLAQASGYKIADHIGYPTPGSLSQFGWHDNQIPIICIEEQESLRDLGTVWPRFEVGMRAIFEDLSLREKTRETNTRHQPETPTPETPTDD